MPYIELKDVKKEYQMGEVKITALAGVNFSVEKGELVVVLGPSGAGKTTVLNILGGMDTCDSGHILVGDHLYGSRDIFPRQALNCFSVTFQDPFTNEKVALEINDPRDMTNLWNNL